MHRILTWRQVSTCKIPDSSDELIVFDDKGYIGYGRKGIFLWQNNYYKDNYIPTVTHWAFLSAVLRDKKVQNAIKNIAIKDIQDNYLL